MAKKQFKAESKKLLDLMINSIYTNREIFLRELISNASDAIDKLYFKSLTEGISGMDRSDFAIRVLFDKDNRTITVSDNGIGMGEKELEENLGTIARSGSLDFKKGMEENPDIDIIGQFGVGFYSAFMVADNVKVISRAYGSDEAFVWESNGADGYTVKSTEKDGWGTDVILTLKEDTEDEKYSDYLNEYRLRQLITHYSDYVRYPIIMKVEKHREIPATDEEKAKEDYAPQYEHYYEDETVNSMVPIWKRPKAQVTKEEYDQFYKDKFYDWNDPLKVIHANIEGGLNYNALMYIPSKAPFNYYSKAYEKGLALYSSGVLIMEKCADLLPDYFSFVRGLVDTPDLSLNISREMLQHDRQLKAIAVRIEKKIKSELESMLNSEREEYKKFYSEFGLQLKYGIYSDYGTHRDVLEDLLMFYSSTEKEPVTFKEYIGRMKPDQKNIYYACGESIEKIDTLPQTETLKEKGYEILYCTDDIDEFTFKTLIQVGEKNLVSVNDTDLGLEESDEEKSALETEQKESRDLLDKMKEYLGDKVKEVRLSSKLRSHAVCFSSGSGISMEMEKVLNAIPNGEKIRAERILELNPNHRVFTTLKAIYSADSEDERIREYSGLLYDMASLIEGMGVDDPVALADRICELMK
ncbi:MAG: molecular chaperone HtpG [Eubacteriales bacterium]|nr:molecular chaperone HtpG [Eubacteriales bacterium]